MKKSSVGDRDPFGCGNATFGFKLKGEAVVADDKLADARLAFPAMDMTL